jgi:hypothetical protein
MGSETVSSRATFRSFFSPKLRQVLTAAGSVGVLSSGLVMALPAIAEEDSPQQNLSPLRPQQNHYSALNPPLILLRQNRLPLHRYSPPPRRSQPQL